MNRVVNEKIELVLYKFNPSLVCLLNELSLNLNLDLFIK
jgi:hypothetical protein